MHSGRHGDEERYWRCNEVRVCLNKTHCYATFSYKSDQVTADGTLIDFGSAPVAPVVLQSDIRVSAPTDMGVYSLYSF